MPEDGVCILRSKLKYQESLNDVELHDFGKASSPGVETVVYAVVKQNSGATKKLVVGKSRLAKQEITIPRLELVSAHMAANVVTNVKGELQRENLNLICYSL